MSDPHEVRNRAVYRENVALDKALVRPASGAYGTVVPQPVKETVSNFTNNIKLPGLIVNNLLQGDIDGAGQNSARFLMNSLFGIGGLFDPASDAGLFEDDTDFGETLYVWGAPEGDYVMLPVIGPSTERHMVGRAVDLFTNPISYALKGADSYGPTGAKIASRLGERDKHSKTIDAILHESADGYGQMRLLYLQNRRFKLGIDANAEDEDPYGDPYDDPYAGDPYDQ